MQQNFGTTVRELADQAERLRADITATIATADDLLDELRALDQATQALREIRNAVLVHTRQHGTTSWKAIGAHTEIAPSTWRARYRAATEERGSDGS